MAKVRRLVVSQVEGDYSYDSDKRPNGEISLYEDGEGGFDLVIHDGVNSTSDNKVLGKGKFYGHGADSGDGNGYDTIKLIPDTNLFSNDQYIIVDPTAPGHIHLRAGGEIDNSNAYLYLGGEKYHVKIDDNSSVTMTAESGIENPNPGDLLRTNFSVMSGQVSVSYIEKDAFGGEDVRFQWDFHPDSGLIQLPPAGGGIQFGDGTIQTTAFTGSAPNLDITNTNGLTTIYYPTFVEERTSGQIVRADVNLTYRTDNNTLGVGNISFVGGTMSIVQAPTQSEGNSNDKKGFLAFDDTYIYYCTADYTNHTTDIYINSQDWGGTAGTLTELPFLSVSREPQIGWTISGPTNDVGIVTLTITGVIPLGSNRYTIQFAQTTMNVSNGSQWSLADGLTQENIWKRLSWSGDTW